MATSRRSSRSAAPARSRHHPSGTEPTTFAASTTSVTARVRRAGQLAANSRCRSRPATSASPTQRSSALSWFAVTGSGSIASASTVVKDQVSDAGCAVRSPISWIRAGSIPASSPASRTAASAADSPLLRAPPGSPQQPPWCVHAARCWSSSTGSPAGPGARSSSPAAPKRPHRRCPSAQCAQPSPSPSAVRTRCARASGRAARGRRRPGCGDRPPGSDA